MPQTPPDTSPGSNPAPPNHQSPTHSGLAARYRRWASGVFRWRMGHWVVAAVLLSALVYLLAPQQLPVSLYKLSLVTAAGVLGFWLDRALFPYARPGVLLEEAQIDAVCAECDADSISAEASELALAVDDGGAMLHLVGLIMMRRAIIVAATMLAVGLGA